MTETTFEPAGARTPADVPALLRLRDSLPSYDRLMLARMRLIADTVVEECLELEPQPASAPEARTAVGTEAALESGSPAAAGSTLGAGSTGEARSETGAGPVRPGLPAEESLSKWVLERMTGEHLTCLAAVLDSTITRAYSTARDALIACFSLHRSRALVETGRMRFDRLQYAARRAHRLGDPKLAELDAGIAELRADLSWESYCRAVNDLIRLLADDDEQAEDVHTRRRVEFWRSDPHEGKLQLTGPLEPLYALHRRLEATARAIARAQTGTFGEQLPPGSVIIDDRTVPQLMFDLMSTLAPGTEVEVLNPVDFGRATPGSRTATGSRAETSLRDAAGTCTVSVSRTTTETDSCADTDARTAADSRTDAATRTTSDAEAGSTADASDRTRPRTAATGTGAGTDPGLRDCGDLAEALLRTAGTSPEHVGIALPTDARPVPEPERPPDDLSRVVITCPTNQEWLRRQATVVVTVPFLTLTGHSDLPGHWSDRGPVPVEMARRLASRSSTFHRILTDPVTGVVCDETARSYAIPKGMRMTMNEKWTWCTAPGCTRRAETCDADHAIPFDHADPAAGGRTDLENLHPLCRSHHLMKTEGTLRLRAGPGNIKRWEFPHGIVAEIRAAERVIERAAAREMLRILGSTGSDDRAGPETTDDRTGQENLDDRAGQENLDECAGRAGPGERGRPTESDRRDEPGDHEPRSGPGRSHRRAEDGRHPRPAAPPDPWTSRNDVAGELWTHADDDPPPF